MLSFHTAMDETPADTGERGLAWPSSACYFGSFRSGPEKKESKIMLTITEEYNWKTTKSAFNKITIYAEVQERTISNAYCEYKKCTRTLTFLIGML